MDETLLDEFRALPDGSLSQAEVGYLVDVIKGLRDREELAWGLIANAYGGNWDLAPGAWRAAAERWRDHITYVGDEEAAVDPTPTEELLRKYASAVIGRSLRGEAFQGTDDYTPTERDHLAIWANLVYRHERGRRRDRTAGSDPPMSDQTPTADDPGLGHLTNLMYWMDLGGTIEGFEQWMSEPRRTFADAKAQLLAARRGRWADLFADTNPPANELLVLYLDVADE